MDPTPAAPPSQFPPSAAAPPRGWWSRNWKWFVPVSLCVLLSTCGLGIFGMMSMVFGMLKSSEPYKEAVSRANSSPLVQEQLGTPVEPGFLVNGNISLNNDSGTATLDIPVSGSKGKGSIHVVGDKAAGVWTYSEMDLSVEGKPDKIPLK